MDTSWITDRWCLCSPENVGTIIRGNKNMFVHMTSSELDCYKTAFLEKNIVFKNKIENFYNDIACWTYQEYHSEISGIDIKSPKRCFLGYKFIVNKPALEILNPKNQI